MGGLIDAGLILDNISGRLESMKDYDAVKDVINNMPTAYNLDKVVEQLEEMADKANDKILEAGELQQYYDGYEDGLRLAIEIVKGGGVDAISRFTDSNRNR
mgnify:CR=1 FL=1